MRCGCNTVATMVGYNTDTVCIAFINESIAVRDLRLREGLNIEAVAVTAPPPLFEQRDDRYVYNVANDPDAKRLKMSDMMEKMPVLGRNEKGKLEFEGKPITEILIDGERHELIGNATQYVMNFIRGDVMSQIEVIPPGSPKYNNDKPILNIKTARAIPNGFALEAVANGDTENVWSPSVNLVSKIRDKMW